MLYCMPRGLEVCWRVLREKGKVSDFRWAGVLMFALAMAVTLGVNRQDLKPAVQGVLWVLFGEQSARLAQLKPRKSVHVVLASSPSSSSAAPSSAASPTP